MGKDTTIDWASATLNLAFGCRKVDRACERCYMFRISKKINEKVIPITYPDYSLKFDDLDAWPPGKKIIFVNSMSDTFHEDIDDAQIELWHDMFAERSERNFLLLTKRIGRAMVYYRRNGSPPPNVWVGCSIGEKSRLWRLNQLRQIETSVRFVSFEPLIEDLGDFDLRGIDWAIVGGESDYHKPRPMNPEWAENIRRICERDGVAFFYKQNGGIGGDGAGGDLLNGKRYKAYPKALLGETEPKPLSLDVFV